VRCPVGDGDYVEAACGVGDDLPAVLRLPGCSGVVIACYGHGSLPDYRAVTLVLSPPARH
jgi:hypothetical protein